MENSRWPPYKIFIQNIKILTIKICLNFNSKFMIMVLDSRTCIKVKSIQWFRAVNKIIQDGRQKNIDLVCSGCCCSIGFIFVSLSTFKIVEIKENQNTSLQIPITYNCYCLFP